MSNNNKLFGYLGNPKLRRAYVKVAMSEYEVEEFRKCAKDPIYFIENYVKIISLDKGIVPFHLYPFQNRLVDTFHNNRFVICKVSRQQGKCFVHRTSVRLRKNVAKSEEKYFLEPPGLPGESYIYFYGNIGEFYDQVKKSYDPNNREEQGKVQEQYRGNRLCEMPILRNDGIGSLQSSLQNTQYFSNRIWEIFSHKITEVYTKCFRKSAGRQKPSISAWWEVFPIFKKVYQGGYNKTNQKEGSQNEEGQSTEQSFEDRILYQAGDDRNTSERSFVQKTIDLFFGKMYRKVWSGRRTKTLGRTPTKVDKIVQKTKLFENISKTISFYYEEIFFGNSMVCRVAEGRNGEIQKQRISNANKYWNEPSTRFYRHRNKEDNRVQRGLLAWEGTFNDWERGEKNQGIGGRWIQSDGNPRNGLQERPQKNLEGMHGVSSDGKFIEAFDLSGWEVETDTGWKPISRIYKTKEFQEWVLKTTSGKELIAADTHILFDENFQEIFMKDVIPGKTRIQTKDGPELVYSVYSTPNFSNMYDITVDSEDHRFYTNDILSHNTTTTIAYLLWCILFNDNFNIGCLAHKAPAAIGMLAKLKLAYENLPQWLQSGIVEWNKGSVELDNGSKIAAFATTGDGLRSGSFHIVVLDEFAFVPSNIAEEFMTSTYPVITAGQNTKIFIISTPKGMNHFFEAWQRAIKGISKYVPFESHWMDVPGRDERWKEETIRNTSELQFSQEFDVQFLGSTNTLINGATLSRLLESCPDPIWQDGDVVVFEEPKHGRTYTLTVDVAEGQGKDYSAFSITDVTEIPYRQVARYRNNKITPYLLPTIILQWAFKYNQAFVLIEINTIGLQVADILHFELNYENIIKIETKGKLGQQQSFGFKKKFAWGLKHSKQTKAIGAANLKTMVESNKLIIQDIYTVRELTTFVANKQSFSAEEGCNDDLVMTLLNFGWLTSQRVFKEVINNNIRKALQEEQLRIQDEDLLPFAFLEASTNESELDKEWVLDRGEYHFANDPKWKI